MTDRLRWGILSTADINNLVIPAIRKNPRCEVRAVASRDADKARKYASSNGIPISYGSYDQLLDDDQIDAIYISLPNTLHHDWCVKAAKAGKHILCEKPLAMTIKDCVEMIDTAKENNIFLQEGFMYRYHPRTQKIKQVVESIFDKNIKYINGAFSYSYQEAYGKNPVTNYRMSPEMGGGCLWDIGSYVVNFIRYLTGSEPIEVLGSRSNYPGYQVDGLFCGVMRFPGDIMAQFMCSYLLPQETKTEIFGEMCSLTIPQSYCLVWDKKEPVYVTNSEGIKTIEDMDANAYEMEIDHFCDCVLDRKDRVVALDDAVDNIRVIQALLMSAKQGCVVRMGR